MELELITIGDELLLGHTLDTNSVQLSKAFGTIGVRVVRRTTVTDSAAEIAGAVAEAMSRSDMVVTTGGLGPTSDDRTRQAVSDLLGRDLILDEAYLKELRKRFAAWGMARMPDSNLSQAQRPYGSEVLPNRKGSAPGIWVEQSNKLLVMLPGVPHELKVILDEELIPRVRRLLPQGDAVILSRTVRTTDITESALADRLEDAAQRLAPATLAFLPDHHGVDLRLTVMMRPAAAARDLLDSAEAILRDALGDKIYGTDDADLAEVVLRQLRLTGLRLAVAESCTGGMIGARLTAVPGSSDVFSGGIVAYSNDSKIRDLSVDPETIESQGAVSQAVAEQMARGVAARFGEKAAIAVTGIAGPDGGTSAKPVGTVYVAVRWGDRFAVTHRVFPGDRRWVRLRATQYALNRLRLLSLDAAK